MSSDAASLERMHDIIVPGPIPWWPPAPGWQVLLVVVGVLLFVFLFRSFHRWQQNAYRREALAKLKALDAGNGAEIVPEINVLLKRAALSLWPREEVAGLTGDDWLRFLDQSGKTSEFTEGQGKMLGNMVYRPATGMPGEEDEAELVSLARHWLQHHRRESGS